MPSGLGDGYSSAKNEDRISRARVHKEQMEAYRARRAQNASNGALDAAECLLNLGEGYTESITSIFTNPYLAAGAGTAAAVCILYPPIIPAAAKLFFLYSGYELTKGTIDAVNYAYNGDWDNYERAYKDIGRGAFGIMTAPAALKGGAAASKEIKAAHVLGETSLSPANKAFLRGLADKGSILDNMQDITSLYTSREGLSACAAQLKPEYIAARAQDLYDMLKTAFKGPETELVSGKKPFKETAEGKRRAALTHEQVEKEVKKLVKEVFDRLEIPEELRPPVIVYNSENQPAELGLIADNLGGAYSPQFHKFYINEDVYKLGGIDLPDIDMHEMLHASKAVLRQRLPESIKQQAAKEHLLGRIKNGDKPLVPITGEYGLSVSSSPKLTPKVRSAFMQLAQDKLYQNRSYTLKELEAMVRPIAEADNEFVKGYKNIDEAVRKLAEYAGGHNERYKMSITMAAGFDTSNIDTKFLKSLTPEETEEAVKVFIDGINVLEDNAAVLQTLSTKGKMQYLFTPEEVLAVKKGGMFQIEKLEEELAQLRKIPGYDTAREANICAEIRRYELTMEHRTLGRRLYELNIETHNNPGNIQAAEEFSKYQSRLDALQSEIDSIRDVMHPRINDADELIIDTLEYSIKRNPPKVSASDAVIPAAAALKTTKGNTGSENDMQ